MLIYKTTNNISGKIYIGLSTKNDPKYLGSGRSFRKALKKYGRDSFTREVLEMCDDLKTLYEKEQYWIAHYKSNLRGVGYNLSIGGESSRLGVKCSEHTKVKIAKANRGNTGGWNRGLPGKSPMEGRKHSEESREKMRRGTLLRNELMPKNINGKNNPMYVHVNGCQIIYIMSQRSIRHGSRSIGVKTIGKHLGISGTVVDRIRKEYNIN